MGSCGGPAIVGDPSGLSVMEQPSSSELPAELDSVQETCLEEDCNGAVVGSVEEGHVGCSASFVENEGENDDTSQFEKIDEDGCRNSLGVSSEDIEVIDLKSGGLCSVGNLQDEGNIDLPLESVTSIVGDPSGLSVMEQPLSSGYPEQLDSVQESCSEEPSNVLDQSGMVDGSMGAGHVGCSASFVDAHVTAKSEDALKNECENDDLSQLEETNEDGCQNTLGVRFKDVGASDLKSGGLCSEGNFPDLGYVDLPLESITSNNLQEHCDEHAEQKDEKSIVLSSAGYDLEVMEGKNDDGADLLAGAVNCELNVRHSEVSSESDFVADLLVDCDQKYEPEEITRSEDSLPKVVESCDCDALDGMEANSCRQISPSLDAEVPSGALCIDTKLESTSDMLHDQKNGQDCDSIFEEKIRAVVKNEITQSPLLDVKMPSGALFIDTKLESTSDMLRNQKIGEDCDSTCEEKITPVVKNDITQSPLLDMEMLSGALFIEAKLESTSDMLHDQKTDEGCDSTCEEKIRAVVEKEITANSYVQALPSPYFHTTLRTSPVIDSLSQPTLLDPGSELKDGILQLEDNLKPFYPASGQSSSVSMTNSTPKDVPDLLSKDGDSINNNCAVDDSGQTNNDGKEAVEVDCITESIPLPSQRNSQRTKFGRKTQTRKASRKSKNKVSETHPGGGVKMNLEAARKKRSCLSKPARSCAWGLLGNVEQFFQYENELGVSEAMCQNEGKARNKSQGGTTIKNGASSSSLSSIQKHNVSTSTTRFRLKIKYGKENDLHCSNVPESVGGLASASYLGSDSGSQNVTGNSADKFSEVLAVNNLESFRNDLDKDCVVVNGQIVNSQLENSKIMEKLDVVAEETCHAVPPERVVEALVKPINNSVIDPGTSPDSEVIDSIPEVQVGERLEEDAHLAVLGSSDELNSNMDATFRKREKKKGNLTRSGNCITQDGSQGQPGNNTAKHSKNHRRKKNCSDIISSSELPTSTELIKSVMSKELAADSLPCSGEIVLGVSTKALKVKSQEKVKSKTAGQTSGDHGFSEFQGSGDLPSSRRPLGRKLPKSLEPKVSKAKSKVSDSTSSQKTTTGRKEKQKEPINKSEAKGKGVSLKVTQEVEDHPHPGSFICQIHCIIMRNYSCIWNHL